MSSVETRNVTRDSLFLFADMAMDGQPEAVRVKVRNLSAGGMMADGGELELAQGDRVAVSLRNVGQVNGSIAWVQGGRFGVAFDEQIDPKLARAPVVEGEHSPRFTRPPVEISRHSSDKLHIRKL